MAHRKHNPIMTTVKLLAFDVLSAHIDHTPEIMHGLIREQAGITAERLQINEEAFQICYDIRADYTAETEDGQNAAAITARYRTVFQIEPAENIDGYTADKAAGFLKSNPGIIQTAAGMFNALVHKDLADLRRRHNIRSALPIAEMTVE